MLVWVRAVATAVLAGVIAKIIFFPPGALAAVPLSVRLGRDRLRLCWRFLLVRRSVFAACGRRAAASLGVSGRRDAELRRADLQSRSHAARRQLSRPGSASTSGCFLHARRRLQRDAFLARDDMDVEVEHHLSAGALVELLDGDAVGAEDLTLTLAILCATFITWARSSGATSRMLRAGAFGITSVWPGARGMMSRKASALSSS